MSATGKFNLRVYGLMINEDKHILLTDEHQFGKLMTKFPGGGVEFGEGLLDALKREWLEECGQQIGITRHFYTTDFAQISAFNAQQQIISVYYLVHPLEPLRATMATHQNLSALPPDSQVFRWTDLMQLEKEELTFPIDRYVLDLLQKDQVSGKLGT